MSRSTRNWLLVVLAMVTGMVAQELLGKLSAAKEVVRGAERPGPLLWNTAEKFYASHPLAFPAIAPAVAEQDPVEPASEPPFTEPPPAERSPAPAPSTIADDTTPAPAEPALSVSTDASPTAIAVRPEAETTLGSAAEPPAPAPPDAVLSGTPADEPPAPAPAPPAAADSRQAPEPPPTIRRPVSAPPPGYGARVAGREAVRYPNPATEAADRAIHQRAALKAAERTRRLETFKWHGYSPSRPVITPGVMGGSDASGAVPLGPPVLYYTR